MILRSLRVLVAVAILAPAGCFFDFNRGLELEPGDLAGRAFRASDSPAPYAKVLPAGMGGVRRTDSDGRFLVKGLSAGGYTLSISDDENGDGWPERATDRSFAITSQRHSEGLFGQGEAKLTWVDMGDVVLDPIVEVSGRVTIDGASAAGALVYVWGTRTVPGATRDDGSEITELTIDTPAEAWTAADDGGAFRFPALAAGELTFAAFYKDPAGDDFASTPVVITAAPGETITQEQLSLALVTPPDGRSVQLELSPLPDAEVRVVLEREGVAPADFDQTRDRFLTTLDPGAAINFAAPIGSWHVTVTSGSRAVSQAVYVSPVPGPDLVTWRMALSELDPCERAGVRDCDGDTLQGIPPVTAWSDPAIADVWAPCAAACGDRFGADLAGASCEADGETWDCDDDGDGQPDVTEHFLCYGLFLGEDLDADGLCSTDDPYPQCAQNDPEHPDCRADRDDEFDPPPVRPEVLGDVPVDGGVDAGADAGLDAGADSGFDAGVDSGLDAGTDGGVDGGFDAGPSNVPGAGLYSDAMRSFYGMAPMGSGFAIAGKATAGPLDLGGPCTITMSSSDLFVAGFGADRSCQWITAGRVNPAFDGGFPFAHITSLVPLPGGGLAVVGGVEGQLSFEGATSSTTTATTVIAGARDVFWVRLDSSGQPVGEVNLAGPTMAGQSGANGEAVALADGSLVLGGTLYDEITFDRAGSPSGATTTASSGGWIARVLPDDSLGWVTTTRADGQGAVRSVAALTSGGNTRVFAGIHLNSGTILGDTLALDSANGKGVMLVLDGATGGELFANQIDNGSLNDGEGLVASDAAGRVAWPSRLVASVTIPSQTQANEQTATRSVSSGAEAFISFYDYDGELREVAYGRTVESGSVYVESLAFEASGDLTVGGYFRNGLAWQGTPLIRRIGSAGYVTRLTAPTWSHAWTTDATDTVRDVVVFADGTVRARVEAAGGETWFGGLEIVGLPEQGEGGLPAYWDLGAMGESEQASLLPTGSLCSFDAPLACADRVCRADLLFETQGRCSPLCDVAGDCPAGSCHAIGSGTISVCVDDTVSPAHCLNDAHCAMGEVCPPATLECTTACTPGGCASGEVCNVDLGICEADCFDQGFVCPFPDLTRCAALSDGWACRLECGAFAQCGSGLCSRDGRCSAGRPATAQVFDDTWQLTGDDWQLVPVTTQPPPLRHHALGATSSGPLLFGGLDDQDTSPTSTWRFVAGDWVDTLTQGTSPGFTWGHAGAGSTTGNAYFHGWIGPGTFYSYDPSGQPGFADEASTSPPGTRDHGALAWDGADRVYLFGGLDGSTELGDFASFDTVGNTWTSHAVDPAIGARWEAGLSRWEDSGTTKILLAGGRTARDGLLDDTWVFDPTGPSWTRVGGASLGKRAGHALAWDGTRVLAYGGTIGRATPAVRDLLVFNGTDWQPLKVTTPAPPPRTGVRLAELGGGGLVLYGGDEGPASEPVFDEEQSRASNGTSLPGRYDVGMEPTDRAAYVTTSDGSLWRFGGVDGFYGLSDALWRRHPDGTWEQQTPLDATWPAPRSHVAGAAHPTSGRLFFYGGKDEWGNVFDDLWAFDPVTGLWQDFGVSQAPGPRASHVMGSDVVGDRVILAAGEDGYDFTFGTYGIAADGTVTALNPATELPNRVDATIVHTPNGVHAIGGLHVGMTFALVGLTDEWIWDGSTWTAGFALPRGWAAGAAVFLDISAQRILVFGGEDGEAGGVFTDVMYQDLSGFLAGSWRSSPSTPWSARARAGAVYDGTDIHIVGGSALSRTANSVLAD
jgi:hypothetical protein